MMKRTIGWIGAALVIAGSCGNDDGAGPATSDLAGTWKATRFEYVSVANSSQKVDVIDLGGEVTVTLTSQGAFTLVVGFPDEPPETFTGTWSASRDVLTFNFATGMTGQMQFDMQHSGDTMMLSGANGEFDIDDDGQDEPVKVNMTLTKQ